MHKTPVEILHIYVVHTLPLLDPLEPRLPPLPPPPPPLPLPPVSPAGPTNRVVERGWEDEVLTKGLCWEREARFNTALLMVSFNPLPLLLPVITDIYIYQCSAYFWLKLAAKIYIHVAGTYIHKVLIFMGYFNLLVQFLQRQQKVIDKDQNKERFTC